MNALKHLIDKANRIVFLGGAGLSTESGIPDFRSSDGVFKAVKAYGVPPETLLSIDFFEDYPEIFYDYYKKYLIYPDAKPNKAHKALAKLEAQGKLNAVVTQNIDGLHQAAGSKHVCELHGSVYRNHCTKCRRFYSLDQIMAMQGVPTCECGGIIKPDVVLYGEGLDNSVVVDAIKSIREADTMIVGGTSLNVYPAAGLIDYFRGDNLIVINLSPTPRDREATICVHEKIGEALSFILD
ncbi:MAG: NAD-dependent protein deacylase [Clostridia bacterium]|jgi:NAD-dependent deacetylase|nr:NAD-dependent protein deacylase [Clostridia bacterium]MBR2643879.1 NAD-dependent protein deacylase [Clostridia bacterium]MBR3038375.1 NAD-dependent protein deacylase [Clostridia bacterium]